MKTKRVLIVVEANRVGERWGVQMGVAVDAILASGFHTRMWSTAAIQQRIYDANGGISAECVSAKFLSNVDGNCPPKFVMELPAHLVRKGVPTYRGRIK